MKKDRIYDFKELKSVRSGFPSGIGKDAGAAAPDSRNRLGSGNMKPDDALPGYARYPVRPGTKVVLMDSDLKGTVCGTGEKVRIELDDGLVIDAGYGEFAVADPDEEKQLRGTAVNPAAKEKPWAGKNFPGNIRKTGGGSVQVDLHIEALSSGRPVPDGHQLEYQLEFFRHILRKNIRHRGMKISFIHGVGDGILRSRLCKELDEVFALKCTYSSSPAVTVVTIR